MKKFEYINYFSFKLTLINYLENPYDKLNGNNINQFFNSAIAFEKGEFAENELTIPSQAYRLLRMIIPFKYKVTDYLLEMDNKQEIRLINDLLCLLEKEKPEDIFS